MYYNAIPHLTGILMVNTSSAGNERESLWQMTKGESTWLSI